MKQPIEERLVYPALGTSEYEQIPSFTRSNSLEPRSIENARITYCLILIVRYRILIDVFERIADMIDDRSTFPFSWEKYIYSGGSAATGDFICNSSAVAILVSTFNDARSSGGAAVQ